MARLHHRHQFRLALCGHKAVETGAVCLALMVQGHIAAITLGHLGLASKTGLLAVAPVLVLTLTRYARHLANRWTASAFLAMCAFAADAVVHESHYPGELTEAALTAVGAFGLSLAISYTPLGKYIDRLAERFSEQHPASRLSSETIRPY